MQTTRRKKIGWLLLALALGALTWLALSDVQLVKVTTKTLPATGARTQFMVAHWPLGIVSLAVAAGLGLIIFPRGENVA